MGKTSVKVLKSADIKRADLLGISPFANRIAFVQVKGSVLLEAMRVCFPKSVLRRIMRTYSQ
ncbi:5'-nucleotidase C-terminal domain-containing protein [Mycoplasmopsis bovis]|nr:5'-nucleotidase C-terminal domain-containing protein [Mycoplasmopsis bovis]